MKTIAIYHKDCEDGTAAAAVVLRRYPGALLFPFHHSHAADEMSKVVAQASPGDRILTVDCVLGAREFLDAGYEVTSIDHHADKEAEYRTLAATEPRFTYIFDNSRSGASLAWATLFPNEPMPELIKYIEDVDLWRWRYGDESKDVSRYLSILENQPEETLKLFDAPLDAVMRDGHAMSRYVDSSIAHNIKENQPIDLRMGGYVVPFYNITSSKSAAGNMLSAERGKAVALFTIDGDRVTVSFRSQKGQTPTANEIARIVGGGGHEHASGASFPFADFIKMIVWPE